MEALFPAVGSREPGVAGSRSSSKGNETSYSVGELFGARDPHGDHLFLRDILQLQPSHWLVVSLHLSFYLVVPLFFRSLSVSRSFKYSLSLFFSVYLSPSLTAWC